jgi:uncharacterized membrane protein YphA (DoxX/SURF4 family)
MTNKIIYTFLTYCISLVWIINGFFCKVLNLVPRHQQIVAKILGSQHAQFYTIAIGSCETLMAVWILSRIKTRINAIVQIAIVASMNTLEFIIVPNLLLWGKLNAIFAFIFIVVVYCNEFYLNKKLVQYN